MAINERHAPNTETLLAVDGQGISFHFGKKKKSEILNNVNIAVNPSTIYSLLGPSGCGKTTLLKCITGQHQPKAGSIKIYGRIPGSEGFFIPGRGVGYMPQDLALYMDMTTQEILTYFGSLYGMSMKDIRERITFLVELLELPNKKKLIHHLSGGQQRRVSFAIALIHKPPLLVLDEPTVGVDPLLRKSIWDHLICLAKNDGSTVVITTHYTEEARQAHIVGFMRNGHLLVQRNPEILIKIYGGFTLEDVFLKVCQKTGNDEEDHETNIVEFNSDNNTSARSTSTNAVVWCDEGDGETFNDPLRCVSTSDEAFKQSNNFPDSTSDEAFKQSSNFPDNTSDEAFKQCNNFSDNTLALLPLSPVPTEIRNEFFRGTNSWRRLYYLTRKNFLRLIRNASLVLFLIGLTVFEIVLFFVCVSSDPFDLEIAIVNEDTGKEGLNKFGEIFLNSISDQTINKKTFQNWTSALESVKRGESYAALHIGSEFSQCLLDSGTHFHCAVPKVFIEKLQKECVYLVIGQDPLLYHYNTGCFCDLEQTANFSLLTPNVLNESLIRSPRKSLRMYEGVEASNDTLQCSRIRFIVDTSDYIVAVTVYRSILDSFQVFLKDMLLSVGKYTTGGEMILEIERYPDGPKPSTYLDFLISSMILCITYVSFIAMTAIAIITERKYGLMSRTLVAGATTTEVLISYFFALLVFLFVQVITLIVVTFYAFSAPCHGPLFWIIVACTLTGICGMSYGLILSVATDDESIACIIGSGTFFPTLLISAAVWPLEAMPYYMRYISNCLPLTRIIAGARYILTRGWSITDNYVWDGYLICSAWIVAQVILSITVLKLRK